MNHLHEVIESVKSRSATVQETIPSQSETDIIANFMRMSKDAICFDAGDGLDIANINGISSLIRLPYRICWIEFVVDGVIVAAMCETLGESPAMFHLLPFTKRRGANWHMMDIMAIDATSHLVKYISTPEQQEWYKAIGAVISRFLSALNCTNVGRVETNPPTALNKARVRRGKQPLFSTWTLSISIPKERRDSLALGGSHASPRVHLRRGHPREYKPGLWTWVQPCAVGAKESGMIHKDYKAVTMPGQTNRA